MKVPTRGNANLLAIMVVFGLTLSVRLAVRATVPTEWDSALLLQGIDKFDVVHMSPHPPGSFLYVQLGHALHIWFGLGRQTALVVLSALASSGATALAFLIGNALRNRWLGALLGLSIATNPLVSFYGSIVATYSFDLLGATALIALALHARKYQWTAPVAFAVVALAAGFRTNALIFDMPIALFVVWRARPGLRMLATTVATGIACVALWLIPLSMIQPGGITAWREASSTIFRQALDSTSIFFAPRPAATQNIGVATAYTAMSLIVFIPALLTGLAGRVVNKLHLTVTEKDTLIACALLTLPSFTFAMLGHWGKAGYLLMFFPGILIPLAVLWSRLPAKWLAVTSALVLVGTSFQVQRFSTKPGLMPVTLINKGPWFTHQRFWAPFPETLTARRAAERQTKETLQTVESLHPNSDDKIIMLDGDNGDRYAHVAWAFPESEILFVHNINLWTIRARNHKWDIIEPGRESVLTNKAIWVITKSDREDLQQLVNTKKAERLTTNDHAIAWRVQPCTRFANINLVSTACSP